MKYRIAISGSYGGINLGDEAILEGILKQLRETAGFEFDIVVFSFNPKDTEKRHKVRAIPIKELHKDEVLEELKKLDLFILGGGGILFDGVLESYLRNVIWAKELGIPVMVYAVSTGPLQSSVTKNLVVDVLNQTDVLTVRESETKRTLNDLGVTKEIEVTADPAFLIDPKEFSEEMLIKEGINLKTKLVGFSVREPGLAAPDLNADHYHAILANAADFMIERYDAQILFIPMEGDNRDPQHSHAVISKMFNVQKATVLKGEYTAPEVLDLFKYMDFAVGMRFHFLIFSAMQHIPFAPLAYASKVKGLLEDLDTPISPIHEWSTGKLCAVIDRAWDSRSHLKKKLEEKIPALQDRARKSNTLLIDFLKTIKPKA